MSRKVSSSTTANRSRVPEKEKEKKTSDTSGQSSSASSRSVGLQKLLGSKLRRRLDVYGSPEYVLTWKKWDMQSGPQICALRASARRILDRGSSGSQETTGWPTPNAMGGGQTSRGGDRKDELLMGGLVKPCGWPTPNANPEAPNMSKTRENGRKANRETIQSLGEAAKSAGWPTPRAEDSEQTGAHRGKADTLNSASKLAGWGTPTSQDAKHASLSPSEQKRDPNVLRNQAHLAGWQTPMVNDELGSEYCYGKKREDGTRDKFLKLPGAAKLVMESSLAQTSPGGTTSSPKGTEASASQKKDCGKSSENEKPTRTTPRCNDDNTSRGTPEMIERDMNRPNAGSSLAYDAVRAGWQTPTRDDAGREGDGEAYKEKYLKKGQTSHCRLRSQAHMAGWPTPNVPNGGRTTNTGGYTKDGRKIQADLGAVAKTAGEPPDPAGWPTPQAATDNEKAHNSTSTDFSRKVETCMGVRDHPNGPKKSGWPTPKAQEDGRSVEQWEKFHEKNPRKDSSGGPPGLNLQVAAQLAASKPGTTQSGTSVKTKGKEGYRLNPAFSLWLMGYPAVEWACSGERAMRSVRKSRQSS